MMRRTRHLIMLILLMFSQFDNLFAQISKEEAIDIVDTKIVGNNASLYNVYMNKELSFSIDVNVSPFDQIINPYDTSWLFFIDLMPEYGWSHPCQYVFVHKMTGDYSIIDYNMPPPYFWLTWEKVSVPFPHQIVVQSTDTTQYSARDFDPDPHKYALLICWDVMEDTARWNNFSHVYTGLRQTYGFLNENIFVLSGNGVFDPDSMNLNLDGDTAYYDFDGPCSKEEILTIFDYLDSVITSEDIFIFYATTHGDTLVGDTLITSLRLYNSEPFYDYELADLADDLNCSHEIFIIDACHAGGMADDLEGNHREIQVPVPRGTYTLRSWNSFDFFTYGWATAMRGWHPLNKYQPWNESYRVGKHPDLTLVFHDWDKPDTLPDLVSFNGNGDSIIQMGEMFNYAKYLNGQTQVSGIEYHNDGFEGDLLTLNGIEGRVDTTQSIIGNYLIGRKLTLAPGVTLSKGTFPLNLYLDNNSEILILDSAKLDIDGYSGKIIGCTGESYITVEGELNDTGMDFSANPGAKINIDFKNIDNAYNLEDYSFNNADISGMASSLSFSNSSFNYSKINFSLGDLLITDSNEFQNSYVSINNPGTHYSSFEITGNTFENSTSDNLASVITVEDYSNFLIQDNEISYDFNRGIELFYAGWDACGEHAVNNNTIHFTGTLSDSVSELGIHSYYTNADIHNNKIQYNDYGITGFHHSALTVLGDSLAEENDSTQLIGDNTKSQCLFNISTFPTEFHWNILRDVSSGDKPFIKVVEFDEMREDTNEVRDWSGNPIFDVTYNCWVNDTNPDDRLIPSGAYTWRPAWCPGSGHLLLEEEPGLLFEQAMANIEEGNYTAAESGFRNIISDFPENKYAQASMKELFALNPVIHDMDYTTLMTYCDSLSINPGDSLLGTTADWLSIHCKIKDKQYQSAINELDSVLSNAGTVADSVFAMIDLNYVYLKTLDSNNLKSSCITKNESILANNTKAYSLKRKEWIELLMKDNLIKPGNESDQTNAQTDSQLAYILSLHPNPASEQVNISYQVEIEGNITISLFSLTGQKLIDLNLGTPSPGKYSLPLSLTSIPQGIYVLTLSVDGAVSDRTKVVKAE
jgi:hypothetical protein